VAKGAKLTHGNRVASVPQVAAWLAREIKEWSGAVGGPDARAGVAVKAVVVRRDESLTEEALPAHCRRHRTAYPVSRQVELRREPLPKTHGGKFLRRRLALPGGRPGRKGRDPGSARAPAAAVTRLPCARR